MSEVHPIFAGFADAVTRMARAPKVYTDLLAAQIRRSLLEGDKIPEADGLVVDQLQCNGMWCIRQLRVTLPNGMGTYRVLIAPPDAPIQVNGAPIDRHFLEPIVAETKEPA